MKNFFAGLGVGILGSLIAAVIWMHLGEPVICSLSYAFPPVYGDYLASYPNKPEWPPESVTIKQLGPHLSGRFNVPKDREAYDLTGRVTSSRMVLYQFTPKNQRLNDYGVGLIKLDKNGDGGAGYVLYLSDTDEKPVPIAVVVKKEKMAGR